MRSRLAAVVSTALLIAVFWVVPVAWAAFQQQATAQSTFSTDVMQPPTNLSASANCTGALLDIEGVSLTWTATPTTWATGQEVRIATTSAGPWSTLATVARTATSYSANNLLPLTTYWFEIRAVSGSWSAPSSVVSRATTLCA